ncbi:carbohydrate-binding domain-containing protein [Fusibacter sp. 3D3]|uniref:carbohydrate-binding domain-containing protein n=1 Tax=Fusibacter sp. 3D3 TaxID=1048380 RepID=UPI000852B263|nr:carbohydrate-binding domain-containing protein [Fusibacter sp. 3D3]GAU79075.1 hypothetical protein F3D3_3713 [Fusibacter sp. 3D3]
MNLFNSFNKGKNKALVVFILTMIIAMVISGCSNGNATPIGALKDQDGERVSVETAYENSALIKLGDEIVIEGDQEGITVTDQVIHITKGGVYNISGTLREGQILLEGKHETFTLELDGVDITNSSGPAILTLDAEHTYILLVENTVNTLSDGGKEEEHEAPLFSGDDMTISGEGTLNIFGNYQEGIESNDILTINGGIINIEAVDDALNAGDGIVINGGTIIANSGGDGIDSNGDLTINGGYIKVSAGNNANGPVDIGDGGAYKFTINGGTLVASGGNMSIKTDTSATQNVIWIYDPFTAHEEITLTDEAGNILFNTTLEEAASSVLISTDSIKTGQTYNLIRTDKAAESFVISEVSTTIGESKGMGGNRGGRSGRSSTDGAKAPEEGEFTPPEGLPEGERTPPEGEKIPMNNKNDNSNGQ